MFSKILEIHQTDMVPEALRTFLNGDRLLYITVIILFPCITCLDYRVSMDYATSAHWPTFLTVYS